MEAGIRIIDLQDSGELLQLLALQMAAYVKEAEMIGLTDIPPLLESPETLRRSGETFYGCYPDADGGELAGAVSVRREADEADGLRICRLMVRPERFRRGIAALLLRFILEEASGGTGTVNVRTFTTNTAAMALYSRYGFLPTGRVTEVNGLTLAELSVARPDRPQTGTE